MPGGRAWGTQTLTHACQPLGLFVLNFRAGLLPRLVFGVWWISIVSFVFSRWVGGLQGGRILSKYGYRF